MLPHYTLGATEAYIRLHQYGASGLARNETEKDLIRRVVYIAALALVAMLMLAPGAMAQQMNHQHMMPNGQMMDDNMMASPSASASASPSATASTSASASPSATATPSAPPSHHHGGSGISASAAAGSWLPSTGGVPWVSLVSVGAVALLVGSGLVAGRLLRRNH